MTPGDFVREAYAGAIGLIGNWWPVLLLIGGGLAAIGWMKSERKQRDPVVAWPTGPLLRGPVEWIGEPTPPQASDAGLLNDLEMSRLIDWRKHPDIAYALGEVCEEDGKA